MNTQTALEINTSEVAYKRFLAEKKDAKHYRTIIKTLVNFPYLSNKTISEHCELTYNQVARRTGKLRDIGILREVAKMRDPDGSLRTQYSLR
ncbi:MAG: hypothetical protein NXH86_04165 [Flavobacteriaceae bacterium]|nr:hypothetical protein [Flavobacteriaceae bacterium]